MNIDMSRLIPILIGGAVVRRYVKSHGWPTSDEILRLLSGEEVDGLTTSDIQKVLEGFMVAKDMAQSVRLSQPIPVPNQAASAPGPFPFSRDSHNNPGDVDPRSSGFDDPSGQDPSSEG
jgi:hypothetical protein